MEINWGEVLLGVGGTSTVIGAVVLRKINKYLDSLDAIPKLIDKIKDLDEDITKLSDRTDKALDKVKTGVDSFSGELRSLERSMHQNSKEIAVTTQRVDAAFREFDTLSKAVRGMKI